MQAVIASGYLYEIVGLAFYVAFLVMNRRANVARFSMRSRVLALVAAIVLVACVPLGYARAAWGGPLMLAFAAAAVISAAVDRRRTS